MKYEIEITRQDYGDFCAFHFFKTRLTKTIVLAIFVIVAFELFYYTIDAPKFNYILFPVIFLIVYPLLIAWQLKRTKKIPVEDGPILGKRTVEVTDNLFSCNSSSSSSNMQYSKLKSIEDGKSAYYIYVEANMAFLVPKRYLGSQQEQENFYNTIKNRIGK